MAQSYNGVFMPMDEAKNESKGFAFVEFLNPDMANAAVDQYAPPAALHPV